MHKANEDCESTCHAVPGPSCASSPVSEYKLPLSASTPVKENVSARKLKNSFLEEIEREHGIMTRKTVMLVGVESSSQVEHAVGFKLHDTMLLNECFPPLPFAVYAERQAPSLNCFGGTLSGKVCQSLCF